MSKKLTKHGNSLALVIEKPLLEVLKINATTPLDISIENGALIIRPLRVALKPSKAKKNQSELTNSEEEIDEIAERIMNKYSDVFKKLSKT